MRAWDLYDAATPLVTEPAMKREHAVRTLAQRALHAMSDAEKLALALDWWTMSPEDQEWQSLPDATHHLLARKDEPGPADLPHLQGLILLALRRRIGRYTNEWLGRELARATGEVLRVHGVAPSLERCPCCGYRSLPARGEYDVCPVCVWEDDGADDPCRHSAVNRASIASHRGSRDIGRRIEQEHANPRFEGGVEGRA